MDPQRPGRTQQAAALIMTAALIWFTLPEWQRRLLTARAGARIERLAGRVARAEGRLGMGHELHDRLGAAQRSYGAAYELMQLRERLRRARESV